MSKHPAVKTLESFEFSFQPSIKVDLPYPCQVLGFDVLGQQRLDLLHRLGGGEFGEQATQVCIGFKIVGPRGLNQAVLSSHF
jgi:hypothetical protein